MIILRSIELGSGKLPPAPKLWKKCVHLVTELQKHANPLASDKTFFLTYLPRILYYKRNKIRIPGGSVID